MQKKVLFTLMIIVLMCSCKTEKGEEELLGSKVTVPNPSAVFCEKNKGQLKVILTNRGHVGYCIFNNKSICKSWDYFNNKCRPGDCKIMSKKDSTGKLATYDCNGKFLYH